MKTIYRCLVISLVAISALQACKKSVNDTPPSVAVMFVNGCAATTNVIPSAHGSYIADGSMHYLDNTVYFTTPAGENVSLACTENGNSLAGTSVTLDANEHYSAFLGGTIISPFLVVTRDNLLKPATGKTGVRFVNLSPDKLELNCSYGGTKLISGVQSQMVTQFFDAEPGSFSVSMADKIITTAAVSGGLLFSESRLYTVVFAGKSPAYSLVIINNY